MSKERRRKWNADRLALFSQHLANLLEAGFPLVPSIRLLSEQGVIGTREAERILGSLDQGKSLSAALAGEGMPALFTSLIRAAEEHGDYGFGLKQCEVYYRERGHLIRELTRALTYPIVVLILVGLAFLFLMTTVVPRFSEMYETMGLTLPLYTRIFLMIHQSLQAGLFGLTAALVLFGLIYLYIRQLPPRTEKTVDFPAVLPAGRPFLLCIAVHPLSGHPIGLAIEVRTSFAESGGSDGHPCSLGSLSQRDLSGTGTTVGRGVSTSGPGTGEKLLPSLPGLVALGEETGALDRSLLSLARGTELMIKEPAGPVDPQLGADSDFPDRDVDGGHSSGAVFTDVASGGSDLIKGVGILFFWKLRQDERGFTLIEMLVVLFVIAVIIAIALPNLKAAGESAQQRACEANRKLIGSQADNYYLELGSYPSNVRQMKNRGYLNSSNLSGQGKILDPQECERGKAGEMQYPWGLKPDGEMRGGGVWWSCP